MTREAPPELPSLTNQEYWQRIEGIIRTFEVVTGDLELRESYSSLLSKLSDRQLERVRFRIDCYSDRQLIVMHEKVSHLLGMGNGYDSTHREFCFLFDTTIWALWFSEGDLTDYMTASLFAQKAYEFFSPLGPLDDAMIESDEWLDYSLGYMIEVMVEHRRKDHQTSGLEHLRWIGENVEALAPYREVITSLRDASREFCDIVLNNASPSLSDGML